MFGGGLGADTSAGCVCSVKHLDDDLAVPLLDIDHLPYTHVAADAGVASLRNETEDVSRMRLKNFRSESWTAECGVGWGIKGMPASLHT